jgi:1,2-diacylglycerol 3-alpha-glucosyltransferase
MRIALFTEAYLPMVSGVVVAVATLRQELLAQGHEVQLFAPNYPGYKDQEAGIFRAPSLFLPTNPRYPISLPLLIPRLRRALVEFAPEVIHTHSLFGMGQIAASAARQLDLPLIFTYHTLLEAYCHYIPLPQTFMRWVARTRSRLFSNNADQVIAPGPAAQAALLAYGVTTPISIIPTGVDLTLAQKTGEQSIIGRWGIPAGMPVVAFTGRIAIEKNLDMLLEAFEIVARKLPSAHLLLIGGGPWQTHLEQVAVRKGLAGRVHISGFLPRAEVFQALRDCTVFAFPSVTDTQGIAVLEAMACGLPAVAAQSGAVAEILRPGKEGSIVPAQPEPFAQALLEILTDASCRARMSTAAQARAQEFSGAACAERILEVYKQAQLSHRTQEHRSFVLPRE